MSERVSRQALYSTISRKLGKYVRGRGPAKAARIHVVDNLYTPLDGSPLTLDWITNKIEADHILSPAHTRNIYRKELFDCDDYVFLVRSQVALYCRTVLQFPLALGCLLTRYHAFNFCYQRRDTLVLINTQREAGVAITSNEDDFESFLRTRSNETLSIELVYV